MEDRLIELEAMQKVLLEGIGRFLSSLEYIDLEGIKQLWLTMK
jgi:hypothetical protein